MGRPAVIVLDVMMPGQDGAEGVAMAAERPDLILLDLSLPVMDGWEAARRIRGQEAGGGVPSIALTALRR